MTEKAASARLGAEFVGTFLLVFTVGCNVLGGNPTWGVTSIAAVLMVSIYALAGSSGANFNPAVSVALGLVDEMKWSVVATYCGVQVLGGIAAALAYGALFWKVFPLGPQPTFGWWQAGLAEFLYTFMLCFVVLNCACAKKNADNQFFGLAIGFVIIAGGYGAGAVSGGCFNPAVAIGIDVSAANQKFGWSAVYVLFELAGAAAGALLYKFVRPDNFGYSPDYDMSVRCTSEFVGTFFLVLTVGLNVLGGSPAGAWSIAASLMCMIFALGNCSGAHFNPAVTVAIVASGRDKITVSDAFAYIFSQVFGAILAAVIYVAMHSGKSFPLQPGAQYLIGQALFGEFIFTFVLCFVVLGVATIKKPYSQIFGLAIGSCVTAGGLAIGGVSGGSLNPAVSTGIALSSTSQTGLSSALTNLGLYSAAEFLAGGMAAFMFSITHPSEYTKDAPPLPRYT